MAAKAVKEIETFIEIQFPRKDGVHISKHINTFTIYYRISEILEEFTAPIAPKVYPCEEKTINDELLGLVKLLAIREQGIVGVYDNNDDYFHNLIKNLIAYMSIFQEESIKDFDIE